MGSGFGPELGLMSSGGARQRFVQYVPSYPQEGTLHTDLRFKDYVRDFFGRRRDFGSAF